MPLFIKDDSVDVLAIRLSLALDCNKTQAVKRALETALKAHESTPTRPQIAVKLCQEAKRRAEKNSTTADEARDGE